MDHCELFGILLCNCIYNIKPKIELIFVMEINGLEQSIIVFDCGNKTIANKLFLGFTHRDQRISDNVFFFVFTGHNNCHKQAILAADRNHTVRRGAVVIDAVALFKILNVIAYLHLQLALEHHIELLSGVLGEVDRAVLQFGIIFIANPVRFCQLFAKHRSKVGNLNAILLCRLLSLTAACYRVGRKVRAAPHH